MVLVGMYASPQASGKLLTEALEKAHMHRREDLIIVGDLNARNKTWHRINNRRGSSGVIFAKKGTIKYRGQRTPHSFSKDKNGQSKSDLLLYRERVTKG